jgi:hypothetical protein
MACEEKQVRVQERVKQLVDEFSAESQQLAEDVQREAGEIDPDIDTSGIDVWVGADIDIRWEETPFSLDLPEVTMRDQRWALDLPQVTMNNKDIIFHVPEVRMVRKKTGEYPEVTCRWERSGPFGMKVPKCTTKWSPIYMDIPEVRMEEKRIVLGVPEFRMDRTEMVLAIPEFAMRRRDFSLKLPQITVKDISVEAEQARQEGEALSEKAKARTEELKNNFSESAKAELGPEVTDLFYCYESDLAERRNEGVAKFNEGVAVIEGVISSLVSNKVPDDNETLAAMRARLKEAQEAREKFAADIEEKFRALHQQQAEFFDKLLGGSAAEERVAEELASVA